MLTFFFAGWPPSAMIRLCVSKGGTKVLKIQHTSKYVVASAPDIVFRAVWANGLPFPSSPGVVSICSCSRYLVLFLFYWAMSASIMIVCLSPHFFSKLGDTHAPSWPPNMSRPGVSWARGSGLTCRTTLSSCSARWPWWCPTVSSSRR